MVKYGYCKIVCTTCNSGLAIKTNIQRDSNWEPAIHTHKCQHFQFTIDLFTYDSFIPSKDTIIFRVRIRCVQCLSENIEELACKGFDNRCGKIVKECDGHKADGEFRLDSNTGSDYAVNTLLYSFGLYGTLVKYISKKIGDHLELYVIGNQVENELNSDNEIK